MAKESAQTDLNAQSKSLLGVDSTDNSQTRNLETVEFDGVTHLVVRGKDLADNPEFFEDTSFVTGESPVTLDFNTALGRNATQGWIINDGAGNFTVAFSTDGSTFGDAITMKKNEVLRFESVSVDSVKITWVSDSAYRATVI